MIAYALPLLLMVAPVTVRVHLAGVQCRGLIADICDHVARCTDGDRARCLELIGGDGPWGAGPTCREINQWHDELAEARRDVRAMECR